MNQGLTGLLNAGNISCYGHHFGIGHTLRDITHHTARIVGARTVSEFFQLCDRVIRVLAFKRRVGRRFVARAAGTVTTHTGGNRCFSNTTSINCFTLLDHSGVKGHWFRLLACEISSDILDIGLTQSGNHSLHRWISTFAGFEIINFLNKVGSMLPRQ